MAYRVNFTRRAEKDFRALEKATQRRLALRIDALADEPRPHGVKRLGGADDLYRVRAGDYRIIYQINDKELLVLIVRIGHRSDIYR